MNKKIKFIISEILVCSLIGTSAICYAKTDTQEVQSSDSVSETTATPESSNEATITLKDNGTTIEGSGAKVEGNIITINEAGVYTVSGSLSDGQIVVEAGKEDKVEIVLKGASIKCSNSAAIYVKSADETILNLKKGTENSIEDGETYSDESIEAGINGAIYSKADLRIKGSGTLNVIGNYNNGIVSKDDLRIKNGIINVTAANNGLKGKDSVQYEDATLTVNAQGDAIKSDNDEDENKGYIEITSGTLNITSGEDAIQAENYVNISGGTLKLLSGDDGIHADEELTINNGNIDIQKSYEGLESASITINDGNIKIVSSDDGINAAEGSSDEDTEGQFGGFKDPMSSGNAILTINGGSVYVNASGDGLDANGSIIMTGGTVLVDGPTSNGDGALDYDKTFDISGGVLVEAGSSGMAQNVSTTSTQNAIKVTLDKYQTANTIVNLQDSNGNNIVTYAPSKEYNSVVISSPEIKNGSEYIVNIGGQATGEAVNGLYEGEYTGYSKFQSFTVSSVLTNVTSSGATEGSDDNMMGGGPGGERPNRPGQGERPEIPGGTVTDTPGDFPGGFPGDNNRPGQGTEKPDEEPGQGGKPEDSSTSTPNEDNGTTTPSDENNSGNTSDSSKLMLLILGVFSAAALKISSAKKALKIRK